MDWNKLKIVDALGESKPIQAGDKVKYIGTSNEQVKWGSNDDPRGLLTEGETYIVEAVEPHSWHTKYYLKEFPGKKFNSVSFEKVSE